MDALTAFIVRFAFALLDKMPGWLADKASERVARPGALEAASGISVVAAECGDEPINLERQRLLVTSAFGTYFAGLLEREHGYVHLQGQLEMPASYQLPQHNEMQSLAWALQSPKGPRQLVIAGEGGMGKTTLAARLIRCLVHEGSADLILGDSAKTQVVDPLSGSVAQLAPSFLDAASFFRCVAVQLGLPEEQSDNVAASVTAIADRIEGRRAIVLVDNQETLADDDKLLPYLSQLASRDVRVIITTRACTREPQQREGLLLVRLKPITTREIARSLLRWHIDVFSPEFPDLERLRDDLDDGSNVDRLVSRTGGVPLLMQLILSDIARSSWTHLDDLPRLFGSELLEFLYRRRWDELTALARVGDAAMYVLVFIVDEQFRGRTISYDRLHRYLEDMNLADHTQSALHELQARFMVFNYDTKRGNFAVLPSLAEFVASGSGQNGRKRSGTK